MIWIVFLAGIVLGAGTASVWWRRQEKREQKKNFLEKEKIDIILPDLIRIASCNTALDVSYLILEYKINIRMPEFYEKYQLLNKQEKELYFNELIDIFSRNKREYVDELLEKYSSFSKQDVLLLLMCEMQLDNKTMARIMGLSLETLKKRKTRLKQKMFPDSLPVKGGGVA